MSGRLPFLTAAGHAVHRVRGATPKQVGEEPEGKPDAVPIIERYQDIAQFVHRTVVTPRGDRFIMACVCGWAQLSPGGSSAKASLIAQQHVIDKAEELMERLEPKPLEAVE